MHENYKDITSRIAEPPKWWDENGAPRYDEFHPDYCPDIYAHTVILLRISCQNCGRQFDVEMSASAFSELNPRTAHYGDPPAHNCTGDSMNCEDLAVLQVWRRLTSLKEWKRHPKLEGKIK